MSLANVVLHLYETYLKRTLECEHTRNESFERYKLKQEIRRASSKSLHSKSQKLRFGPIRMDAQVRRILCKGCV